MVTTAVESGTRGGSKSSESGPAVLSRLSEPMGFHLDLDEEKATGEVVSKYFESEETAVLEVAGVVVFLVLVGAGIVGDMRPIAKPRLLPKRVP